MMPESVCFDEFFIIKKSGTKLSFYTIFRIRTSVGIQAKTCEARATKTRFRVEG